MLLVYLFREIHSSSLFNSKAGYITTDFFRECSGRKWNSCDQKGDIKSCLFEEIFTPPQIMKRNGWLVRLIQFRFRRLMMNSARVETSWGINFFYFTFLCLHFHLMCLVTSVPPLEIIFFKHLLSKSIYLTHIAFSFLSIRSKLLYD